jgi:hypothetical protein
MANVHKRTRMCRIHDCAMTMTSASSFLGMEQIPERYRLGLGGESAQAGDDGIHQEASLVAITRAPISGRCVCAPTTNP